MTLSSTGQVDQSVTVLLQLPEVNMASQKSGNLGVGFKIRMNKGKCLFDGCVVLYLQLLFLEIKPNIFM